MTHPTDAEFWDAMYRNRPMARDGEPNAFLAREAQGLAPGSALDIGCGEGSDAIWLARRGWSVTAVDVSKVALDRAREADPARAVNWLQADMLVWQPPADAYDLVSAHYLHLPPAERAAFFGRLAAAVRPGGLLLFVSHHPSDLTSPVGRPPLPELYFTAEDVAALLPPGRWEILVSGTLPNPHTDHGGRTVTIHDTVLKARRIS